MERKKPVDGAIGQRIQEVRLARGLTRRELARKVGITQRMIRYYEQGWVRVSVERLAEFASALGCSTTHLLQHVSPARPHGTPQSDHDQ